MEAQHATVLRCWLSSIIEAVETKRDRDKIHDELLKKTIYKYFPIKKQPKEENVSCSQQMIRSSLTRKKPRSSYDLSFKQPQNLSHIGKGLRVSIN